MGGIPEIHDGYFDGLWLSSEESVHLFVRTLGGERSTIILKNVEVLNLTNFLTGNIVFEITVVPSDKLVIEDIQNCYQETRVEVAQRLLAKAHERKLSALYISPSYGAQCAVLFESSEIVSDHVVNGRAVPAST
jgi:hypothetical protein